MSGGQGDSHSNQYELQMKRMYSGNSSGAVGGYNPNDIAAMEDISEEMMLSRHGGGKLSSIC